MKYLLFTLIGVTMMLGAKAQEKVLTMEETILGYQLYPQNKNVAWQGEKKGAGQIPVPYPDCLQGYSGTERNLYPAEVQNFPAYRSGLST